jgi:hypothetical protein
MKSSFILLTACIFFGANAYGNPATNDSLLTGTWKGTSICQIKPSACNDEIAVYHITKGKKPGTWHMVMNKLINAVEEDMGELDYAFNPVDNSLFCYDDKYKLTWKFIVKGNSMEGTLTRGNTLYRIIKLKKAT